VNTDQLFHYVLRLGDNALILGQQLGALTGSGPELEEEMASANFALDYIGQARLLLSLAGEIEAKGRSEDDLAFLRDSIDFENVLLVERPNGDFAMTVARQFLFTSFYSLLLERLCESSNSRIQEIAAKAVKEVRYHLKHSRQWLLRLGDGTDESHTRMQAAIDELWRFTGELFVTDDLDNAAHAARVGPDPAQLKPAWDEFVGRALAEATLNKPEDGWMADGGKQGRHTEHHGYLLADMQFLQRAYPGASW
jgi:ring-1,2-phenylacetyl-CoA epoxidase subunit PaaC